MAITALVRLPDRELLVAGEQIPEDPEAVRLEQLATRLAVGDRVRWLGRVSRAEMASLARDRVRARYTWDRVAAETLNAYRKIQTVRPTESASK